MNYRHAYHAGNFADVIKHLALVLCLDYLTKKDSPLCAIDAHGGRGLYDLAAEEADKTGEWKDGIGKVRDLPGDDLRLYLDRVKGDLAKGKYPGSPLLMSRLLRPQDRLLANELHPEDHKALKTVLGPKKNAKVSRLDAYEIIRASVPPPEKRGLVLIDPPFEEKNEFQTLMKQMKEWKKRWPTGVYLLWYPIKAHLAVEELKQAASALGLHRTWAVEILLHPRAQGDTFNGSGLILFNAPFTVPERIEATLPALKDAMGLRETWSSWLSAE